MTFEQAVEKIQALLENADTSKMGEVAFQIEFTNKDCSGIMYIANKNGALDVAGYDYKDNTAAVTLKYGDLTKILTGRLNPVNAAALSGIAKKAETAETETKTAAKPAAKTAAKPAAKPATAAKAKTTAAKTTATTKSAAAKTTAAKKTTTTSTAKAKTAKKTTK